MAGRTAKRQSPSGRLCGGTTFAIEWSGPLGAVLRLWMHERRRDFCRGH